MTQKNSIVYFFCFAPHNANIKGFDKLKRGKQQLDNKLFLVKMETHKTKKHMTIDRVGTIASVGDVIKACTNWIIMELTFWDMESGERPIVYQLVTNILWFMMSTRAKEWLANFASSQPQICFVFFQGVENVLVSIAWAAQNFNTL